MSIASFIFICEAISFSTAITNKSLSRSSPIVSLKCVLTSLSEEKKRSLEAVDTGKVKRIVIILRVSEKALGIVFKILETEKIS